jgi:hypothetical protein
MSLLKYNLRKRKRGESNNNQSLEPGLVVTPDLISSIPDQSNQLCTKCQILDLEQISRLRTQSTSGHQIQALDTIDSLLSSTCPICRLFGHSSPPPKEEEEQDRSTRRYGLFLWAFSSNEALTNLTIAGDDTVLLGIIRAPVKKTDSTPRRDVLRSSLEQTGFIALTATTNQQQNSSARIVNSENFDDAVVLRWWEYCCENHTTRCIGAAAGAVRFLKVIDCVSREIIEAPRDCRYVALSYVWGKANPDTDVKSMGSQQPRRALPTLPKTIEDSMVVAKKLGLRYLWVDRYCIDQSDQDDKHQQIQQMDLIYSGAELTIIAAAGDSPDYGLPGVNGTRRAKQEILHVSNHLMVQTLPHPQWSVQRSTWATRAWTYQEAILSRRRLIFTNEQVFWECNGMHCAESINLPLDALHTKYRDRFKVRMPLGSFRAKRPGTKPMEVWEYIREYHRRQLSYPDDALNAMQGILRVFEKATKSVPNLSGVPVIQRFRQATGMNTSTSFLVDMMWNLEGGKRRLGFPSWSWAGWEGGTLSPPYFKDHNDKSCDDLQQSDLGTAKVWVETADGQRQSFPDDPASVPCWCAIEPNPTYIHIEAWTIPCNVMYSKPSQPRKNRARYPLGFFVQIPIAQSEMGYQRIQLSSDDLSTRLRAGPFTKSCIGVMIPVKVPIATEWYKERIYILILEKKGQFYERVGCFNFRSRLVLDWSDNEEEALFTADDKWVTHWFDSIPKTRRCIRLG